jgi:hypothetical protein
VSDQELEQLKRDAARYRWLREQHWSYPGAFAIVNPKSVKLGERTYTEERLDQAIDRAMQRQ